MSVLLSLNRGHSDFHFLSIRLQEDEESQECQNSKRSKYEQELDVSSKENLRT